MTKLIALLLASLAAAAAAMEIPALSGLLMPASITAAALFALIILVSARRRRLARRGSAPSIVIDGSNVLYWKDNTPNIDAVRDVLDYLAAEGLKAGVMFDANAGYLVSDRYQHDGTFSKMLGLPRNRVMVVPKGTPADPYILRAARDLGARIITNDKFRDWAEDFPEIHTDGHLIKGGYQSDALWLEL